MKRIIDGRRYDTDTAEKIAEIPCQYNRGDFNHHDTAVYRTKNGRFFLAGEGNAFSMWGRPVGNNGRGGGNGIRPLSDDEAREWLERCEASEGLEKYFPVEDA